MNTYIIGYDPYKKIKWYHRILKLFGRKIKKGTRGTLQWTDETKTVVKFVKIEDVYL